MIERASFLGVVQTLHRGACLCIAGNEHETRPRPRDGEVHGVHYFSAWLYRIGGESISITSPRFEFAFILMFLTFGLTVAWQAVSKIGAMVVVHGLRQIHVDTHGRERSGHHRR